MATAIQKAFRCIDALAASPGGLTVSELAGNAGLSRPAATRLLDTLAADSLVIRDRKSRRYHLSLRLYELATSFVHGSTPLHLARKEIVRLVAETHHAFNFLVLENADVVILEGAEWIDGQPISRPVPARRPWYFAATGRAIAAFAAPHTQKALLAALEGDEAHAGVPDELKRTRERGYAEIRSELRRDAVALGVPVFDSTGYAVASIGTYVENHELDAASVASLVSLMLQAATRISEYLGYHVQRPAGVF